MLIGSYDHTSPIISHFFFIDDGLLFLKTSVRDIRKIMEILEVYALASGRKINFEKSS